MDWFLYDRDLRHERVHWFLKFLSNILDLNEKISQHFIFDYVVNKCLLPIPQVNHEKPLKGQWDTQISLLINTVSNSLCIANYKVKDWFLTICKSKLWSCTLHQLSHFALTLPAPRIAESCIKIKINLKFCFHFSLLCLKRFYEGLKAVIKPFEAPQRSLKIKI